MGTQLHRHSLLLVIINVAEALADEPRVLYGCHS